jgi:hypothetical protein
VLDNVKGILADVTETEDALTVEPLADEALAVAVHRGAFPFLGTNRVFPMLYTLK